MNAALKQQIRERCFGMDISLSASRRQNAGITPSSSHGCRRSFRPRSIWPEAKTVIVIGLPVSLPILETAPSIWYHELYR